LVVALAAAYLPDQGRANVTTNSADLTCMVVSATRRNVHSSAP